jgi:carbon monoxide dehydrogenase subunit G
MLLEGEYTFNGPRETVWDLLLDPEVLVKALPGAKRLEKTGEDRYEGVMRVGVGPVTAAEWTATVTIEHKQPVESYAMSVDAKGTLGFARGAGTVRLEEQDAGTTRMIYRAELQIGGKIAGVGQRMLETVGKMMTRQGLDALDRELTSRLS